MSTRFTRRTISETLAITIITAFSYLLTFLYEFGYTSYFRIPLYFIEVSTERVIITGLFLYGMTLIISTIYLALIDVLITLKIPVKILSHVVSISILILSSSMILKMVFKVSWWASILFSSLFIGVYLLVMMLLIRVAHTYFTRITSTNIRPVTVLKIQRYLASYRLNLPLLAMIIILPFAITFLGTYQAMSNTTYLVRAGSKNTVVLKKYGEIYIEARYNAKTLVMNDTLIITKMSDSAELFVPKNIGSLNSRAKIDYKSLLP